MNDWRAQVTAGSPIPVELSAAYDDVLEKAADFARRLASLPEGEHSIFKKALSLLSSGKGIVAITVEGDMPLAGLGVLEALLSRSWAVRYNNPVEMWHLAKVAVQVADRLGPSALSPEELCDIQARAWGELANAYRINDRLKESEETFDQTFAFLRKGTGNKYLRATLLDLQASLYGTLADYKLALDSFEVIPALYREVGEFHLAGRALITKALYTFYGGHVAEAIELNREGSLLIDKIRDPNASLAAVNNELLYLTEAGDFRRAKRLLFDNRPRLQASGKITFLRLRWIDGRINYGLGNLESAEIAYREAKQAFQDEGLKFASAQISLELALTLLRRNKVDESEKEVIEASAVFLSLNIHHHILAGLVILEDAFRMKTPSVSLMENVLRYIRWRAIELGLG
jgi:tetratricopeptide (TPR) repeat protein